MTLGLAVATPVAAHASDCYWYWDSGVTYSFNYYTWSVDESYWSGWFLWCSNDYGQGDYTP